jgi:hypothetical protein
MISQDISSKNIDMPYIQPLFICLNRFRVQRFKGSKVQRFRGSEVQKGIKGNGEKR